MNVTIQQVIEDVKYLNAKDRAFIAHCLISSLEMSQDEGVDQAWADLAEKRYNDLISNKTKPVTWKEIKKQVTG
jgi:hypothetical protein